MSVFDDLLPTVNATVLAQLGEPLTVDGQAVQGDFAQPWEQGFLGGVAAASSQPQAVLADADVPADPVGKTLTARGQDYTIADSRPDGYGMTVLLLETAA